VRHAAPRAMARACITRRPGARVRGLRVVRRRARRRAPRELDDVARRSSLPSATARASRTSRSPGCAPRARPEATRDRPGVRGALSACRDGRVAGNGAGWASGHCMELHAVGFGRLFRRRPGPHHFSLGRRRAFHHGRGGAHRLHPRAAATPLEPPRPHIRGPIDYTTRKSLIGTDGQRPLRVGFFLLARRGHSAVVILALALHFGALGDRARSRVPRFPQRSARSLLPSRDPG
jgi:hypothetical protein